VQRDVLRRSLKQLGHHRLRQPDGVFGKTALDAGAAILSFVEKKLAGLRRL